MKDFADLGVEPQVRKGICRRSNLEQSVVCSKSLMFTARAGGNAHFFLAPLNSLLQSVCNDYQVIDLCFHGETLTLTW